MALGMNRKDQKVPRHPRAATEEGRVHMWKGNAELRVEQTETYLELLLVQLVAKQMEAE
jgi:hypothetical protein